MSGEDKLTVHNRDGSSVEVDPPNMDRAARGKYCPGCGCMFPAPGDAEGHMCDGLRISHLTTALEEERALARKDREVAWEALGRPEGTHVTTNVERLAQRLSEEKARAELLEERNIENARKSQERLEEIHTLRTERDEARKERDSRERERKHLHSLKCDIGIALGGDDTRSFTGRILDLRAAHGAVVARLQKAEKVIQAAERVSGSEEWKLAELPLDHPIRSLCQALADYKATGGKA